jgi:hypothetical protein
MEGVHCKVQKDSEIRRFLLTVPELSYLKNHLSALFNVPVQQFIVKYIDDENDKITIASQDDFVLALGVSRKLLRLVVILVSGEAALEVVKCEEENLGKKENEEFQCGKGRKFAWKNEKKEEKWRKFTKESKCKRDRVLVNEPQVNPCENVTHVPASSENPEMNELREQLKAQKEIVFELKTQWREMKSQKPDRTEQLDNFKQNMRNEKMKLFVLRKQFREMKISMKGEVCEKEPRQFHERQCKRNYRGGCQKAPSDGRKWGEMTSEEKMKRKQIWKAEKMRKHAARERLSHNVTCQSSSESNEC